MTATPAQLIELYAPPHPLILLRDEARALQADAARFIANVETLFPTLQERLELVDPGYRDYAGDEAPA